MGKVLLLWINGHTQQLEGRDNTDQMSLYKRQEWLKVRKTQEGGG